MPTPLDYRPPDRGDTGCGELILQSIFGCVISVICLFSANIIAALVPTAPFILSFLATTTLGLAVTILLALRGHPGLLIGFLLLSCLLALLATACSGNFR